MQILGECDLPPFYNKTTMKNWMKLNSYLIVEILPPVFILERFESNWYGIHSINIFGV